MPRAGAGHSHSRRAAPTARFETLLDKVDEVLQGQQAIIERLDRMEAALHDKSKNKGGRPVTFDWRAVERAILRHANVDGFNTRDELRAFTEDFIAQTWSHQPTDRAIRNFLMSIAEALLLF